MATILILMSSCSPEGTGGHGPAPAKAYFSPKGGCSQAVVDAINAANQSILIQTSQVPCEAIGAALTKALARGVKVEVILDRSPRVQGYSVADFFVSSGVRTYIDASHTTANNKTIVIDEGILITGSHSFSKQAEEENAENLLILNDKQVAGAYLASWRDHAVHSILREK